MINLFFLVRYIFFLVFLIASVHITYGQKAPCYKKKKICNFQYLTNCYEKVAFDSVTQRYFSRQNFGVPFDGSCATCHRNGVVEQEITIVEGRRNGTDTSYFPSGCPFSSQSFLLGKPHGVSTTYFDSTNRVKSVIEHYMGSVNGTYMLFDRNGDTLKLQEYQENLPNGVKKEYYEASILKKTTHYKMGLLHGCQIKYDRAGNKQLAISYFEGKKHNTWTYYFDNQEIARKEEWNKGIKEGDFITYNGSGLVISEQHFKKGVPVGIHKEFYQDGREKHIKYYSKKGNVEEEHAFDDYGVKTTIIQRETKAMRKKKRKGQKEDNSLMN